MHIKLTNAEIPQVVSFAEKTFGLKLDFLDRLLDKAIVTGSINVIKDLGTSKVTATVEIV